MSARETGNWGQVQVTGGELGGPCLVSAPQLATRPAPTTRLGAGGDQWSRQPRPSSLEPGFSYDGSAADPTSLEGVKLAYDPARFEVEDVLELDSEVLVRLCKLGAELVEFTLDELPTAGRPPFSSPTRILDPGPWLAETERVATERVTGKVVDFARRNPSTGLGRKQSGSQKAIRAANGEGSDEKGSSWVAQTCGAWRRS